MTKKNSGLTKYPGEAVHVRPAIQLLYVAIKKHMEQQHGFHDGHGKKECGDERQYSPYNPPSNRKMKTK